MNKIKEINYNDEVSSILVINQKLISTTGYSNNCHLRLINVKTGKIKFKISFIHANSSYSVIRDNHTSIFTGSNDGNSKFWNIISKKLLRTLKK
jgi:WD40 repeat protein